MVISDLQLYLHVIRRMVITNLLFVDAFDLQGVTKYGHGYRSKDQKILWVHHVPLSRWVLAPPILGPLCAEIQSELQRQRLARKHIWREKSFITHQHAPASMHSVILFDQFCPSVRPSVCLSNAGIVSKQLQTSS